MVVSGVKAGDFASAIKVVSYRSCVVAEQPDMIDLAASVLNGSAALQKRKCGPANEGDYFNVLLVTGSGLPTSSNTLCYINQAAKGEGDIVFDVYPLLPAQTTDLTLYITSKSDGFTTITIPLCYAVANTYKQAPFIPGDANNDMTININDALAIINHIVGKIPLEGNDLLAADANKDGRVNINDAMQVINQVAELT